jgi:hypothetical protein
MVSDKFPEAMKDITNPKSSESPSTKNKKEQIIFRLLKTKQKNCAQPKEKRHISQGRTKVRISADMSSEDISARRQ